MKKPLIYLTGLALLAACCFLGMGFYALYMPVVDQEAGTVYFLKPGASKKAVVADLTQQGLVPSAWFFSIYTYTQKSVNLKTGEYLFPKGSTPVSIWGQVSTGKGLVYHPFTIIPGWTFKQLRQQLARTENLRHTTAAMTDKQIMERLGQPQLAPEGEFFPETYYYTRGIADIIILKRAFDLMQKKFKQAWEERAPGLPYKNDYEALIAASLVEKEAYLSTERPVIAGVLVNRIRKDMLLQFDPTVIYGLGDRYTGKIYKQDLLEDTAYNTYVHKGLPPTPIAMPSMASILAAVRPEEHDYYYFVAKGNGAHQFSKTLSEHNEAVTAANPKSVGQSSYFNSMKIRRYLEALVFPSSSLTRISNTL